MSKRENVDDKKQVSANSGLSKDRKRLVSMDREVIPPFKEGTVRISISPGPGIQ